MISVTHKILRLGTTTGLAGARYRAVIERKNVGNARGNKECIIHFQC